MSGKGVVVNAGDLPGQDAARCPVEVSLPAVALAKEGAAIRVQASHGKSYAGVTGTMERSRVMIGSRKTAKVGCSPLESI
jgi:hypothetical protein